VVVAHQGSFSTPIHRSNVNLLKQVYNHSLSPYLIPQAYRLT
jgi:hypothetical protein